MTREQSDAWGCVFDSRTIRQLCHIRDAPRAYIRVRTLQLITLFTTRHPIRELAS